MYRLKMFLSLSVLVLYPFFYLYAMQEADIPEEIFSEIFFAYALTLMGSVAGYSKFAKNIAEKFFGDLNPKASLGITLIMGTAFGYFQFNAALGMLESLVVGVVAGGLASGAFMVTKLEKPSLKPKS